MAEECKQLVFLLGGQDLEMQTIRCILDGNDKEKGVLYVDKGLTWGAKLSEYADELQAYKSCEIYGIELERDVPLDKIPERYHAIDHHGEFEFMASSLEQVCAVLKEAGAWAPLTEEVEQELDLKLIAANDKAYIHGLKSVAASFEQVSDIRKRDRDAQGITEDDMKLAAESISHMETLEKDGCRLVVVKALTNRFSAIMDSLLLDEDTGTDRLDVFDRILIYSDKELFYSGKDRDGWLNAVKKAFGLGVDSCYQGGGPEGYFGYPSKGEGVSILDKVQFIKDLFGVSPNPTPVSKHIYLFPFNWGKARNPFEGLEEKKENWQRCQLPPFGTVSDEDVYNELNFFYPFVHGTIYDKMGDGSNLWHFERKEADGRHFNLKYLIAKKDGLDIKRYTLYIRSMNLNFYSTGVGILSIFADNYDYPGDEDVLAINQYGRRIFLPFLADGHLHSETALSLQIEGLNGGVVGTDFVCPESPNRPADFIPGLVAEAVSPLNKEDVSPVLDDRMFVMSWYRTKLYDASCASGRHHLLHDSNSFLYRFVFVDGSSSTCQDDGMRQRLLESSLYTRWQNYGSLYGVTRYSFVLLTTPTCPDFLLQYFDSIYLRLVELALIQRASILRFSRVLSEQNLEKGSETASQFREWYGAYIEFLNKFRFPEASAQEQGIELYDLLCEKMRIRENAEYLDNQFNERQEYLELKETSLLGKLAAVAVPVSIVSACFGFFFHDPLDHALFSFDKLHWSYWLLPGTFALLFSIVLTIVILYFLRRKNRR